MAKFLLDTNILSYLEDPSSLFHGSVKKKISRLNDEDSLCISILSIYELQYGLHKAEGKLRKSINKSLETAMKLPIIPLNLKGAAVFGELKSRHKTASRIDVERHNFDFMIAGSAIAAGAVLVSNDKIFERIAELHEDFRLENWAQERD